MGWEGIESRLPPTHRFPKRFGAVGFLRTQIQKDARVGDGEIPKSALKKQMVSPGWRFREMERTNHMHEFAKVCVHPISQHPSPSSVPIRFGVSDGGVAVSFLLLEGMGDWILASPRLSGFIRPELAVFWGAMD